MTYAKNNGNRAAGRKYSVNEKSVQEWRKEAADFAKLHRRKKSTPWKESQVAIIQNGFCKRKILPDVDLSSSKSDYDSDADSAPQTSTVTKAHLALDMDFTDVFQNSNYAESFENSDAEEDAATTDSSDAE